MHELTHLQTNFGISALALAACILGWCILCLRKAENTSHSWALHSKGKEREFLKLLMLRQGGILAWGERGDDPSVSWCFRGPLLLICIDLQHMEPPEDPWWCWPSANPLTAFTTLRSREEFGLPLSHVDSPLHSGISLERRNFQLHGTGKDDEFIFEQSVTGCIWGFRVR